MATTEREFTLITKVLLMPYEVLNDLEYLIHADEHDIDENELYAIRRAFVEKHVPLYSWGDVLEARSRILKSNNVNSLSKL